MQSSTYCMPYTTLWAFLMHPIIHPTQCADGQEIFVCVLHILVMTNVVFRSHSGSSFARYANTTTSSSTMNETDLLKNEDSLPLSVHNRKQSATRFVPNDEKVGAAVCDVCRYKFQREEISPGRHRCFVCQSIFGTSEWSKKTLCNHRVCKRKLICRVCTTLGHTARDIRKYRCDDCDRWWGHTMFDKNVLKNWKQRSNRLRCLECSNKCNCIACGHRFEKNKKNKENQICQRCKQNGYSMMHPKTYTCSKCKKRAGYRKFTRTTTFHTTGDEERLTCIECHKKNVKRGRQKVTQKEDPGTTASVANRTRSYKNWTSTGTFVDATTICTMTARINLQAFNINAVLACLTVQQWRISWTLIHFNSPCQSTRTHASKTCDSSV